MNHDELLMYLQERKEYLNLSGIAREIELRETEFIRAVNGQKNSKDTVVRIPERCLPKLEKVIKMLRG